MKDGYRYFVAFSTGEDGLPVTSNDPSYFRFRDVWEDTFTQDVEYRLKDGEWKHSALETVGQYLDDVLGSGATVRELLDEKDVPHA